MPAFQGLRDTDQAYTIIILLEAHAFINAHPIIRK